MFENDDYVLQGDEAPAVNKAPAFIIPGSEEQQQYIVEELLRVITLTKKHDLQEKPEVLAGILDDLSAKIKGGKPLDILKSPVVYGGIAAVLIAVILYKMGKRKKK